MIYQRVISGKILRDVVECIILQMIVSRYDCVNIWCIRLYMLSINEMHNYDIGWSCLIGQRKTRVWNNIPSDQAISGEWQHQLFCISTYDINHYLWLTREESFVKTHSGRIYASVNSVSLLSIMACSLFGAKTSSESSYIIAYWNISNKFYWTVNRNTSVFVKEDGF